MISSFLLLAACAVPSAQRPSELPVAGAPTGAPEHDAPGASGLPHDDDARSAAADHSHDAPHHHAHWGYAGAEGPARWAKLDPDYQACETGRYESPIDIVASATRDTDPPRIEYRAASHDIVNNGHTIEVDVDSGDQIRVSDVTYELKQFHFHTPSENHIRGRSFPLEAHFVHAASDGRLAVLAVMFEVGAENPVLAKFWRGLPSHPGEHHPLHLEPQDLLGLMPEGGGTFVFPGSLTTPPCSEGVTWIVFETPVTVSRAQVDGLLHIFGHSNNRPIQNRNGRPIEYISGAPRRAPGPKAHHG